MWRQGFVVGPTCSLEIQALASNLFVFCFLYFILCYFCCFVVECSLRFGVTRWTHVRCFISWLISFFSPHLFPLFFLLQETSSDSRLTSSHFPRRMLSHLPSSLSSSLSLFLLCAHWICSALSRIVLCLTFKATTSPRTWDDTRYASFYSCFSHFPSSLFLSFFAYVCTHTG